MNRILPLTLAFLLAACMDSGVSSSGNNELGAAGGRYLVGFEPTTFSAPDMQPQLSSTGATVRHEFPDEAAIAVQIDPSRVGELQNLPGVAYVEEDPVRTTQSLSAAQLTPGASNGLYGLVHVHATDVQAMGITGQGVIACVADTSLDTGHPDIAGNFVEGVDAVGGIQPGNNPDVEDGQTHGTHVAGTILGVNNNVGVVGVAYGAQLKHARVLGPQGGNGSDIMAGVQWLKDHGCRVVNMSLGGGGSSTTEANFYARMRQQGLLVVVAAGNDGKNVVSFPAAYPGNVAVAAVDQSDAHATFSNTGPQIAVSAPGVGVLSSVRRGLGSEAAVISSTEVSAFSLAFAPFTPDGGVTQPLVDCGLGQATDIPATVNGRIALIQRGTIAFADKVLNAQKAGAVAAIIYNNAPGDFRGTLGSATPDGGTAWIPAVSVSDVAGGTLKGQLAIPTTVKAGPSDWDYFDGTLMATPHVTGVAALILSKNPSLTPDQVESILKSTADDLGDPGVDQTFGAGRVNALKAIQSMH